ncbi:MULTISPECIES: hypothetical protein [Roseobacteraceae]|jgi:hypothetical protein|uniref:Uncharacterized protein n=1 Tax=Pseudosulfitobacter pseudonitzschiae TaxID=1402135 RepID=A0A221K3T6_9RHOB|nr:MULTISPECIES: hypothetical protein [Roseobacteraceae]ASM73507.1 hypothetical protein SULPSESMR1_02712 [Pseudosulfitobacter pseudonitzschiae]
MKVLHDTPDRLILDETPWLIALLLAGFILVFVGSGLFIMSENLLFGLAFAVFGGGIGAVVMAMLIERLQIIFDRHAGTVTIRRKSMRRYTQVSHNLDNVSHAELETTIGSKGDKLSRPVLVITKGMSEGRHPLITAYSNLSGPPKIVAAINGWLKQ